MITLLLGNDGGYGVDFGPTVFHIDNVSACDGNSFSEEIGVKNALTEVFAHALIESVVLGDGIAAYRLQNQIALLLF